MRLVGCGGPRGNFYGPIEATKENSDGLKLGAEFVAVCGVVGSQLS